MRNRMLIALMTLTIAGGAGADARITSGTLRPATDLRLIFAQIQIDDLSQSEFRRLVYYADRATRTLEDLVEGAEGRSISDQDKINRRFRESIMRMADAGARSGLTMDQVADFYTQDVLDTFGQGFMQKLDNFAGGIDFRTLFRNVSTVPAAVTAVEGQDLMDALADASSDLHLDTPYSAGTQVAQEAPVTNDSPVAFPNANEIEVAIVKRIQVIDGRWELTITTGDSLSSIASAVYGDALSYTTIQGANPAVIDNPDLIEVGTRLVIPKP